MAVPNTLGVVVYVGQVTVGLTNKAGKSAITVALSKLELFHAKFNLVVLRTLSMIQIATPLNLSLTMDSVPEQPTQLRLNLSSVGLVLAHSDVLALIKIYVAWMPFLAVLTPPPTPSAPVSPASPSEDLVRPLLLASLTVRLAHSSRLVGDLRVVVYADQSLLVSQGESACVTGFSIAVAAVVGSGGEHGRHR